MALAKKLVNNMLDDEERSRTPKQKHRTHQLSLTDVEKKRKEYLKLKSENDAAYQKLKLELKIETKNKVDEIAERESTERDKIAEEELVRFRTQVNNRRELYANDCRAYQDQLISSMEWKYCRRSYIENCNCKKCYMKKKRSENKLVKKT